MKKPTYEDYLADAAVRESIERAARRSRVEALRRYLIQPVLRFCGSLLQIRTVTGPRLVAR